MGALLNIGTAGTGCIKLRKEGIVPDPVPEMQQQQMLEDSQRALSPFFLPLGGFSLERTDGS